MIVRRRQGTAALVVVALLTSGCGSPPTPPTPDPTASSSSPVDDDAAAFAAAEATYRAYVDAVNARRSNGHSSADPVALLADEARQAAVATATELESSGLVISGPTNILWVEPRSTDVSSVVLGTCVDSSRARVLDPQGNDVTPASRPDRQVLAITVDIERALITDSVVEGAQC
ncbi:hypothetical protein [Microbacterium arborescens]|uniref:hypothetical protein n=1 Tax=Microbacterium arborescens TaxID=33883 RepID=UPI003C77D8A2